MGTQTYLTFRAFRGTVLATLGLFAVAACGTETTAPGSDLAVFESPDGSQRTDGSHPPGGSALARRGKALLRVVALNDKPGPVDVIVQGWDVHGDLVVDQTLTWDDDDNVFSIESTEISKKTRVLRLTFVGDVFTPGDPDLDRNALIDAIWVNHLKYEGEEFDRTDGPDPQFPGCSVTTLSDAAGITATAADCGNEGDWVEYDLHPGNPMGRGRGLRNR